MISTVISDGALALITLASALPLLRSRNPSRTFGAAILIFIGLTAAVGAMRFAGMNVALFHDSMTWTSKMIAVPLLGGVFAALGLGKRVIRPFWLMAGIALGGLGWALPQSLSVLPSALGMLLILVFCARLFRTEPKASAAGCVGVALYLVMGLVIGTKGRLWGIARVDLFHYGLAFAHPLLAYAMQRLDRSEN